MEAEQRGERCPFHSQCVAPELTCLVFATCFGLGLTHRVPALECLAPLAYLGLADDTPVKVFALQRQHHLHHACTDQCVLCRCGHLEVNDKCTALFLSLNHPFQRLQSCSESFNLTCVLRSDDASVRDAEHRGAVESCLQSPTLHVLDPWNVQSLVPPALDLRLRKRSLAYNGALGTAHSLAPLRASVASHDREMPAWTCNRFGIHGRHSGRPLNPTFGVTTM